MHQAHRKHRAPLSRIGPHRIPAPRTLVGGIPLVDVLAISARGAQTPGFDFTQTQVHAVHFDMVAACIEVIQGREFAQRGRRRPHVLVYFRVIRGDRRVSRSAVPAEDDRLQRHAFLGEGIVRCEALVGQEVEGFAVVQFAEELAETRSLRLGPPHLVLDGLVLRACLPPPDQRSEPVGLVADRGSLPDASLQHIEDPNLQSRGAAWFTQQEPFQIALRVIR